MLGYNYSISPHDATSKRNPGASQLQFSTSSTNLSLSVLCEPSIVNYTSLYSLSIPCTSAIMSVSLAIKLSPPKHKDPKAALRPDEFVMLKDTATKIKRQASFVLTESEHKRLRICPLPVPGDVSTDHYLQRVAQLPSQHPDKLNLELDLDTPLDDNLINKPYLKCYSPANLYKHSKRNSV